MKLAFLLLALLGVHLAAAPSAQDWAQKGRQDHAQGLKDLALYDYQQALRLEQHGPLRAWVDQESLARSAHGSPVPAPEPRASEDPLPPALAAWLDGPASKLAAVVNQHNLAAAKSQQILYAFYACGEARFEGGRARLLWDPAPAQDLAERIGGETRVLPWLKLEGKGSADWNAVARQLAAAMQRDRRLAGLCLDGAPEPTRALLAALRPLTQKPLMAVLDPWDPKAIAWADVAVVPLFNRSSSPDAAGFKAQAGARARLGLAAARQAGVKAFLALPLGASFEPALQALQGAVLVDDPAYLGGALWTVTGPLEAGLAERLKLPLVAP